MFPVTGHFFICSFLVRIWLPSNPVLITLSPVQCFVRFFPLQINYGRVRHDFKFQTHPLSLTPSSLSLSPFLLVPCQLDVVVFELFSGKLVKKLDGGHYNMVTCCAVKPNDFEVYTGSSDKGIVVWSGKLHSDEEVCGGGGENNAELLIADVLAQLQVTSISPCSAFIVLTLFSCL